MRILAFTDTHGVKQYIDILLKKSKEVDMLVCAGDISDWGQDIEKQLEYFKKAKKPMLIIPGNHEDEGSLRNICKKFNFCSFIHCGSYEIGSYIFFGYGGGGFSEVDKDFEKLAERFKASMSNAKKIILVTHGPPYGTSLDYLSGLGYRGCRSIRKFVEEAKPILHICGHLHDNAGNTDTIGKTIVVNPGPEGKIIEI